MTPIVLNELLSTCCAPHPLPRSSVGSKDQDIAVLREDSVRQSGQFFGITLGVTILKSVQRFHNILPDGARRASRLSEFHLAKGVCRTGLEMKRDGTAEGEADERD